MQLLRDRSPEFEEAGVRAVGISRDSPWTHIAWMQALDLNIPLQGPCSREQLIEIRHVCRLVTPCATDCAAAVYEKR